MNADGSGNNLIIGFANPITEDSKLETSGGDIVVKLERNTDVVIDSRASIFGEVRARGLPLTVKSGEVGKSRLLATVNEGGARLTMRASGGDVALVGLEPLDPR